MTYLDDFKKLEDLSIKISDLINNNKFENILKLDMERKKIIENINHSNLSDHKMKLAQIININKKSVNNIENKITELNTKHNQLKKRIKFYSLSK